MELPLTWKEKLEAMKVKDFLPVNNVASCNSGKKALGKTAKKFTIRTIGDEKFVFRVK